MIDWEEILDARTDDDLKKAKLWLFNENVRLEREKEEIQQMQNRFMRERAEFREELEMLSMNNAMEKKRLKDESQLFDQKMEILKKGFRMLDEDRKAFEREKEQFEKQRMWAQEQLGSAQNTASRLFESANGSPFAVRKRYRDLVKIFHPDNLCGDDELIQYINDEYEQMMRDE
ncbi:MAG: hypothetical protein LBM69_02005 [Lachnospiraceae bacterium]|nr:hypothetical protein [Lachnospiraceae bacterium]